MTNSDTYSVGFTDGGRLDNVIIAIAAVQYLIEDGYALQINGSNGDKYLQFISGDFAFQKQFVTGSIMARGH